MNSTTYNSFVNATGLNMNSTTDNSFVNATGLNMNSTTDNSFVNATRLNMNSTTDNSFVNATSITTTEAGLIIPENTADVIIWRVLTPCILLLGGFGNIATIFIMRRMKGGNSSQHVILISLAVADFSLLYTAALRQWIYQLVYVDVRNLHTVVCKLHIWLVYSVGTISAWLLTCVTVQRTLAVTWPHKMRALCTVRRTWTVIAAIVIAAFCFHFHLAVGMEVSTTNRYCERSSAAFEVIGKIFHWVDMLISSLLPSLCQLACDFILSLTLYKAAASSSIVVHTNSAVNSQHSNKSRKKTASKTTVMILVLSLTFLALTMPVSVYIIWVNFTSITSIEMLLKVRLAAAVTMNLWYINSAINFLLYCLTGTKFRTEFLRCFRCGSHVQAATTGWETTATALSETHRQMGTTSVSDVTRY